MADSTPITTRLIALLDFTMHSKVRVVGFQQKWQLSEPAAGSHDEPSK